MLLLLFLLSIFCGFNTREILRKMTIIIIVSFGFSVLQIQSTEMISEASDRALYEIYDQVHNHTENYIVYSGISRRN
jgi:hypothetical protein